MLVLNVGMKDFTSTDLMTNKLPAFIDDANHRIERLLASDERQTLRVFLNAVSVLIQNTQKSYQACIS